MTSAPHSSRSPLYVLEGTPEAEIPAEDDRPVRVIAGSGRRVKARIIDLLLTVYLVPGGLLALFLTLMLLTGTAEDLEWVAGIFIAPVLVTLFLLRVARLAWSGCTVGQRVAGLRVVRLEDGVRRPSWRQSLKRWMIPRSQAIIPLLDDIRAHEQDQRLGQCLHDRNAGTVVVLARATARERAHRIVLGSTLAILMAAIPLAPLGAAYLTIAPAIRKLPAEGGGEPAFTVDSFYGKEIRFTRQIGDRVAIFDRTSANVLDSEQGCLAGAVHEAARTVLRQARCEGRIEAAFTTTDGALVSGHVLRFPDAASAVAARQRLKHTDLRFTPDHRTAPKDGSYIGRVGDESRYVVATSVISPKQVNGVQKADNALHLMHSETLVTIIWR
ncbi:RDD family protein [Spirillospora sp. CA-255316]